MIYIFLKNIDPNWFSALVWSILYWFSLVLGSSDFLGLTNWPLLDWFFGWISPILFLKQQFYIRLSDKLKLCKNILGIIEGTQLK